MNENELPTGRLALRSEILRLAHDIELKARQITDERDLIFDPVNITNDDLRNLLVGLRKADQALAL